MQSVLGEMARWRMVEVVRHGWRRYTHFLDNYGWKAQAINTAVLMGSGDVIAQLFIERHTTWAQYEKTRTLRFIGCGLCVFGPSMFVWYSSLDRIVKTRYAVRAAVYKMLMDQTMFLPVYLGAFIGIMAALRGEDKDEIKHKFQRDYKSLLITSYQLWPVIQIGNFYFVPLKHRILLMNFVGLVWNTYIGWKAEQQHRHPQQHQQQHQQQQEELMYKLQQPQQQQQQQQQAHTKDSRSFVALVNNTGNKRTVFCTDQGKQD